MLRDAMERIFRGNIRFAELYYDKIRLLWDHDDLAYKYSDIKVRKTTFMSLSTGFYYFTVFFSIIGAVNAVYRDRQSAALMFCLFILGLTAAHLPAEVSIRYHYSGTAVFAILAGRGLHEFSYAGLTGWLQKRKS